MPARLSIMAEYTREEVLEMVKAGKSLEGADLTKLDLSGADLSNANLRGADLSEAHLCDVNLKEADLNKAILSGAELSGADLSRASLSGAFLIKTEFRGVNLSGANLSRATLSWADLYYTNLTAAVLRNATLSSADLEGASLNNANISGANIYHIKTPSWKIEGIKCTHIYCYNPFRTNYEDIEKKRKESRREFEEGEFEAIYKSVPTIELWFRDKFSFTDELRLMDIQDRLQREVHDAHISLKKKEWVGKDMVITLTVEGEDKVKETAEAVDRLYDDKGLEREFVRGMDDALNRKLFQSIPGMNQAITSACGSDDKRGSPVTINNNITIINQFGDGHSAVLSDSVNKSAIGPGATINIIQKYEENKPEVDELLKQLRAGLTQDRKALVDQFTDALKAKDEGKVKSTWDKIRNGIGTTSNLVSIAGGVAQLLGLYLSS